MSEEIKMDAAPEAEAKDTQKKKKRADVAALEEKIAELEAALSEQNDKYLRMAAEYENFRRRSKEEREGTYAAALTDTVSEILPIIDNLERAVGVTEADGVLKGLEMTLKGADEALTLITPIQMSLEEAIEFIAEDELIEVTPKSIRLRKKTLDTETRMKEMTKKRRALEAQKK